jgi:hypothetical protein
MAPARCLTSHIRDSVERLRLCDGIVTSSGAFLDCCMECLHVAVFTSQYFLSQQCRVR